MHGTAWLFVIEIGMRNGLCELGLKRVVFVWREHVSDQGTGPYQAAEAWGPHGYGLLYDEGRKRVVRPGTPWPAGNVYKARLMYLQLAG